MHGSLNDDVIYSISDVTAYVILPLAILVYLGRDYEAVAEEQPFNVTSNDFYPQSLNLRVKDLTRMQDSLGLHAD